MKIRAHIGHKIEDTSMNLINVCI